MKTTADTSLNPVDPKLQPAHAPRWHKLAWIGWAVLIFTGSLVYIVYLPYNLGQAFNSAQVIKSYPVLDDLLPFPVFGGYVLFLRYLAVVIFLLAALICYIQVALPGGRNTPMSLFTTLMLVLLPLNFIAGGNGADLPFPHPWDQMLEIASVVLGMLGLILWLLFYFIFPSGKIVPPRMRWTVWLLIGAIIFIAILSSAGLLSGEWVWGATILLVLATLMAGLFSQINRYRHTVNPALKNQTRWVFWALVLQPLLLLTIAGDSYAFLSLPGLHLQVLLPTLIPIGLVISLLGFGLWDVQVEARQRWVYAGLAGIIVIATLGLVMWLGRPTDAEVYAPIETTPIQPVGKPLPVIIDTDMAADDWMAILFLLQRPDVEVMAITVTGTGEAHCEPGVRNALGLVSLAGDSGIPVACGADTPMLGGHSFPDSWRQNVDRLFNLELPEGVNPITGEDGVDLLLSAIKSSPEKVTLITLGPLTNLAHAIEQDSKILPRLRQVYIMGGALQVPGNVGFSGVGIDNLDAEWNIYADPLAAKKVIESGAPVTLVPLDATNQVPASLSSYKRLQSNRRTPEAEFVYQVLNKRIDDILQGFYTYWDPLAVAIAIDESLGIIKVGKLLVIADEGPHSGATRLVSRGTPVRYARSADAESFLLEFVRTLNQE